MHDRGHHPEVQRGRGSNRMDAVPAEQLLEAAARGNIFAFREAASVNE